MILAHPDLKMIIENNEFSVSILVIENEIFFCNTVQDIYAQINGSDGKYVLSDNNETISWSKNAELITQYVPFEINKKNLLTKLYSKLKTEALKENYAETCELSGKISEYILKISHAVDAEIVFDENPDISGLFKLANVQFEEMGESIAEKMISYMLNVKELEGDKLFIAVDLKSYLDKEKLTEMYKTVFLHKLHLLLIESTDKETLKGEKKYIIDKDLCEIY